MAQFMLEATIKTKKGTSASRCLRREGKVPAIVYCRDFKPLEIILQHDKLLNAAKNKEFYQNKISLNINNTTKTVIIKALQRHPFKPKILHADFINL